MKTVFIIDGTSGGTCKLDLVNYVSSSATKSAILKKSTTRPKGQNEQTTDLKFIDDEVFNSFDFDFFYSYNGYRYGFLGKEVNDLLNKVDNLFVVIRNLDTIKEFLKKFSQYNLVTVFIYTDFEAVSKRFPNARAPQKKKSISYVFQDYMRHPDIYDQIIINGGTVNDLYSLLDLLVTKYCNQEHNTKQLANSGNHYDTFKLLSKTIVGKILMPTVIAVFSTVLIHQFFSSHLTKANALKLEIFSIACAIIAYFVPQFLLYFLIRSKEQFEKHKIWFEFSYIVLAILAYAIMIGYYTIKH